MSPPVPLVVSAPSPAHTRAHPRVSLVSRPHAPGPLLFEPARVPPGAHGVMLLSSVERFMAEPPVAPPAPARGRGELTLPCASTPLGACFAPLPLTAPPVIADAEVGAVAAEPPKKNIVRYGRIYKRKANSKVGHAFLPREPGEQYCTECKKMLPLSAFYVSSKRYMCRRHHYLRVRRRFLERAKESAYDELAESAWIEMYDLCPLLGYAKPEYDQHDFQDLVRITGIPLDIKPRFVPLDPAAPLRPRNVAVISRQNLLLLRRMLHVTLSRATYILFVQACNLVPRNADVGTPWDPFHDPDFTWEPMDVGPIVALERTLPVERPAADGVPLQAPRAVPTRPGRPKPRLPPAPSRANASTQTPEPGPASL